MSTSKNSKNSKNSKSSDNGSSPKGAKGSLFKSAIMVSVATAASRVLGLVREQVLAYYFGASMATDAFFVAYRIPNLLRDMFAEGALSSAFVPVFKEKLVNGDKNVAFSLANRVLGSLLLVVGLLVLIGIIAAPAIIYISANGFVADATKFDLTVDLTRLMFVYLLLVSLSALVMGMLNSLGKFGIPAISPALFNIGTILSILLLHQFFELPIFAAAIGVLVGGLLQLLIQLPPLFKAGYKLRPRLDFLDEGVKKIVNLFIPMIIGMSAGRVNILLSTLIATMLMEGSVSYLSYSFRLMHFPLGVFAVALGTVALPKASELVAKNDLKGLKDIYDESLGLNLFLIIPSAWVLVIFGDEIVGLIFQHGAFSSIDTLNTGLALKHYAYGLIGFAAVRVTTPIFYALRDSKLPMRISLVTVAVNMLLYWPLISLYDFAGLAAATSIASIVNWLMLLYFLPRKGLPISFGQIGLSLFRIGLAGYFAVYGAGLIPFDLTLGLSGFAGDAIELAIRLISAGLLYLIFCFVFRVRELAQIKRVILRRKA